MSDEKIIARVPRDANNELVIRTLTYYNIKVVDMRWYSNGKPTRKGLRVNQDEVIYLNKAIKKILGDENGNNKQYEEKSEEQIR
tara:strand:+ start:189 stop:440 length:252 start_codon:yes stop_codon:yes gene_type:complete